MQLQRMPEKRCVLRRAALVPLLGAFLFFISAFPAFSHRVDVFAYVEGDTIHTESYFSDGRPVIEGKIELLDKSGKSLFRGVTDSEGLLSFKVPKIDDLTVVLNATMGHRATFLITAEELKEQLPGGVPGESESMKGSSGEISGSEEQERAENLPSIEHSSRVDEAESRAKPAKKPVVQPVPAEKGTQEKAVFSQDVSIEDIRILVREEIALGLSRELGPLHRSIERLQKRQEGPSVTEIIGGIGYIVGLAGIAMYFRSRVKK
jgi:nickel transport protein